MEPRRATLKSMGLRSEKNVALQILQENTWESNLVPDIAGVDYLAGHQGRTNLQPLEGLPPFCDDYFVHGRLRNEEIVRVRGKRPMCTTGEEGSGKRVCKKISLAAQEVWNKNLHRLHRRHSFQKLPLQPHTRDDTTNRGRRRVPDQDEVGGTLPRRGRSRILPCQGRCLGAGAGGAAGRAACHAAPAGGDGFRAVPDQLHAGLCRNSGPGGFGGAFGERARLCPPGGGSYSWRKRANLGQHRQRRRPRLHFCPNAKRP